MVCFDQLAYISASKQEFLLFFLSLPSHSLAAMASKSFAVSSMIIVAFLLISLSMQSAMAVDAPAPAPATAGAPAAAIPASVAGVVISLLAFVAGFAYL